MKILRRSILLWYGARLLILIYQDTAKKSSPQKKTGAAAGASALGGSFRLCNLFYAYVGVRDIPVCTIVRLFKKKLTTCFPRKHVQHPIISIGRMMEPETKYQAYIITTT